MRKFSPRRSDRLTDFAVQFVSGVHIFPKEATIRRLFGAILMEQAEEWTVHGDRYMTLETLAPVCDDSIISLPAALAD